MHKLVCDTRQLLRTGTCVSGLYLVHQTRVVLRNSLYFRLRLQSLFLFICSSDIRCSVESIIVARVTCDTPLHCFNETISNILFIRARCCLFYFEYFGYFSDVCLTL